MSIDIVVGIILGLIAIPILDKMHPEYWGGLSRWDALKLEWREASKKRK